MTNPSNPLQELRRLGQSAWFDNIRRGHIKSGEMQQLIDRGVTGLTSNPTIFEKAISGSTDYDDALLELARDGKSAVEIFEALAMEDIRNVADLLRPVYDQTDAVDGFASIEVNPHLARKTEETISDARRILAALDRPNIMIKVPGTPEGVPAIRQLISEGINVNTTLIFSLDAYAMVREAYISGLETLVKNGGDPGKVAGVASFFVSRVDGVVDALLQKRAEDGDEEAKSLMGGAAIANAKVAYRDFEVTFGDARFQALRVKGAHVQRPLWASTSTKNPTYSDVMYVDRLIGPHTVNTMPDATLEAFLDHGTPAVTIGDRLAEALANAERLDKLGINIDKVTATLLEDGVKSFANSYDQLLANVEEKRAKLMMEGNVVRLGD